MRTTLVIMTKPPRLNIPATATLVRIGKRRLNAILTGMTKIAKSIRVSEIPAARMNALLSAHLPSSNLCQKWLSGRQMSEAVTSTVATHTVDRIIRVKIARL